MAIDLKTLSPDTTLPQSGFLFGADSQAAVNPSVYPVVNVKDTFNSGIGTLTSGPSLNWNTAANPVATVTLTQNATLYASDFKAGGTYKLVVFQDSTGGRTLSYSPIFKWPGSVTPTVTATANAMTVFEFVSDGTSLYGTVSLDYDGYVPTVIADFTSPTDTAPSWIDNSGTTGNRMVTDSTGALTWAPANMLTYSQDATNAVWTKYFISSSISGVAPDGTSTANLIAEGGATNSHFLMTGTFVQTAGVKYMGSIYLKKGSGATAPDIVQICMSGAISATNYANFNLSTGVVTASLGITGAITSIGSGWYRCSVYATAASTTTTYGIIVTFVNNNPTATRNPSYAGSPTSNLYVWGAQFEAVTYQTSPRAYIPTTTAAVYQPRFDYDASTVPASPRGMLIEESRANLLTYSQTLATAWTDTNITRVSTTRTSPDGTGNALEVSASAANGTIIRNAAVGSSAARTLSIWLKRVSGTGNIQYTLDNGSTWTTQAITLDWVRYTFASTTANQQVGFRIVNSGDIIQIWGAQLETGSFATSYIPTTTASVTRVADVVKLSGSALTTAGAATGSAIVQTAAWLNSTSAARDLLSSATTRRLLYSNNSNTVLSSTDGTTGLNATIGGSGTFTGGAVRSAIAWNASGRSLVANNGTLTSDAVSLSTGATATLGGYGTTTTFDGWVASLALYSQKLPDAILKQKSSVGAPY